MAGVVQKQPTHASRTTYHDTDQGSGPLVFAIITTVFAVCCCWWALFCSIPAIIFANKASSAEDNASAKENRKWSLILSVSTIIFGVVGLAIIMGVVFGYYYPTYVVPNVVHGTFGNDFLG